MNKKYCAIIFDFDGTLYDFKSMPKNLILNSPLDLLKIKAERDVRRSMKGLFLGNETEYRLEQGKRLAEKGRFKTVDKAMVWYKDVYLKNMIKVLGKKYCARPALSELLTILKNQNIKTVVFSDYACVEERMNAVGIKENQVDFIHSAEELGGLKPAVEPFNFIAKELNCEPHSILVVGDRNDTDGDGARNAGMDFIQIITHKTKENAADVNHPLLTWEQFASSIIENN